MADETALIPAEAKDSPPPQALSDLRHVGMMMPVEKMTEALTEYKDRRDHFRQWILSQLVQGVHYGWPPGTEPLSRIDEKGVRWYAQGKGDKATWYPESAWKPKPSLYDAGAQFFIDLMGVRAEYESDLAAWEMSGKVPNRYFFKCRLFSRATGALLGEGVGCCQAGGDEGRADKSSNAAIKKAKKSSLVSAVKDTYGLSDLFTQDLVPEAPPVEQPRQKDGAPKAAPRGQAVTVEELKSLNDDWKAIYQSEDREQYRLWASGTCGIPMDRVLQRSAWTRAKVELARTRLDQELTLRQAQAAAKDDPQPGPPGALFDNQDQRNSLP